MKLKPMYDAAKAADEKVQQILSAMVEAFDQGDPEGTAKAMALKPDLEAARVAADEANDLYVTARDAQVVDANENARKFVPVGEQASTHEKQITRTEYEAMDYAERHVYLKNGGAIVDNPAE